MLIVCACKGGDKPPPAPAPVAPSPRKVEPPVDAGSSGSITITVGKPAASGPVLTKRCQLGGDPITNDCVGGGSGIAFDRAGTLYLVATKEVRRYKRAVAGSGADACRFDPAGAPIAMPADNPRPQTLGKGPMYMRSGGAAWHLATIGDAIYAIDYLGGMFRIDSGKAVPACTAEFGYEGVVQLGKRMLIARQGIEELVLTGGGKCKARAAHIDDKHRGGTLFTAHDHLYADAFSSGVVRYDGTTQTPVAKDTRVCTVTTVAACGAGACILDNNCMQLVELDANDAVKHVFEQQQLFETRPFFVRDAATHDGDLYIVARHKDHDVCEVAVYELPKPAFD
jgi:hypothetical protein